MTERPDEQIPGLHHVTSIASNAAENVDFYTDVLGLRMVKKTVNFDDRFTYHLYYGDELGNPGTTLTFFPFGQATPGQVGRGQASATAFTVPDGAVNYWRERFDTRSVDMDPLEERFGETVLPFRDPDGHQMELVAGSTDVEPWTDGPVPAEYALRGFYGVTLDSLDPEATIEVLETLGFEQTASEDPRTRLEGPGERARAVDVLDRPHGPRGRPGAGTVHHIAFRTADEETQLAWRQHLADMGLHVTPQKDRFYFKSIYFREPGGVLFEIATDKPGFTRDESADELGESLQLPPWMESDRPIIEQRLPEI
jgi:glyoxalase family protein